MTSYCCQICRLDLSIARVRTSDDPPEAAWNNEGRNYVGFASFEDFYNEVIPDEQCHQCTTMDRTPVNFHEDAKNILSGGPLWAEEEDQDSDWRPDDDSDAMDEPLDYDSEAESGIESSGLAESDAGVDANARDALYDLHAPEPPKHLPHGTWLNGYMYGRDYGKEKLQQIAERSTVPGWWCQQPADLTTLALPLEHVAAPSCKSLQGINGHVLSVEEMKNCRMHRFLLPKPPRWVADVTDELFENSNMFILSGEANGSYTTPQCRYPVVYPARYDAVRIPVSSDPNSGYDVGEKLEPLPVHTYCLDVYAQASHRRLGRVDLDGIWHWREMLLDPVSYSISRCDLEPCLEVSRAKRIWSDPWRHHTGDEWLAANPVEIPEFRYVPASLFKSIAAKPKYVEGPLLSLPSELVHVILSFLDEGDLNVVSHTCRTLHHHAQFGFKALVLERMDWLWEIFEGTNYPTSPDRPATWDPRFPTGFVPPDMPYGLLAEDDEDKLWKQITDEDPEMHNVGAAVRLINFLRRDTILGPYRAKLEWSLRTWERFRTEVEDWVRSEPAEAVIETQALDWAHIWHLCNPRTTPFPGLRNRARIWEDCQRILDLNARSRERNSMEAHDLKFLEILSSHREQWWARAKSGATSNFDDL